MKNILKKIGIIVGVIVTILVVLTLYLLNSVCTTEEINAKTNQNGDYKIVHEINDCGATTRASSRVFITGTGLFNSSENLFLVYGSDTNNISLTWLSNNVAQVQYKGRPIDIRLVNLNPKKNISVRFLEEKNEIRIERLRELEDEIVKKEASYGVILPEGEKWITIIK